MSNLLKDASILLTPTAYENGRMNAIKPYKDLYGSEIVTNGDFDTDSDWNLSSGSSIANGQLTIDALNGNYQYARQLLSTTIGKIYKLQFEIKSINSGGKIQLLYDGTVIGEAEYTSIGTHTLYFESTNSSGTLEIKRRHPSDTNASIDNVSVKEDLSGDFTFSRNSAATRVNAQGLVENVQIISDELVSNGNFSQIGTEEVSNGNFSQEGSELITNGDFSNGSNGWNYQLGWTFDNNQAHFENLGASNKNIWQSILTTGKWYKLTFEITSISSGYIRNVNSSVTDDTQFSTVGVHTQYFKAESVQLYLKASNDANLTIDNVSVKEVGQDWVFNNDVSIGDGVVTFLDGGSNPNTGIVQSNILTSGKNYKLTFDVTRYVNGRVQVLFGTSPTLLLDISSGVGTYTIYGVSNGTNLTIKRNGTYPNFDFDITNISVKEVGQDWTFGTGWSIGNNVANAVDAAFNSQLVHSDNVVANTKYKISFDVSNYVKGNVRVNIGNVGSDTVSSNGNFTFVLTSANVAPLIIQSWAGGSGTTLSITNISVKEITDDTDLPRINYEGFSYQDSLGSEEVVNGDFSDGTNGWNTGSGWSISGGKANANTVGSFINLRTNSSVVEPSKIYDVSFDVSNYTQGSVRLSFIQSVATSQVSANGTYTARLVASSVGSSQVYIQGIDSFIGSIDNVSVKEYLGQEVVPDSGCGSWLLEPQSTNLVTHSSDLTPWWSASGATIENTSIVSPDGTQNVKSVKTSSTGTYQGIFKAEASAFADKTLTLSAFAKKSNNDYIFFYNIGGVQGNQGVWFNISDGTIGTNSSGWTNTKIENYGNGWYRCSSTLTFATSGQDYIYIQNSNSDNNINSDINKETYIWGTQLEEQSYSTSYVPTSGATNTRLQDIATNSGNSTLINSTEGVLYAEIAALTDGGSFRQLTISDGSGSNRVSIDFTSTDNQIRSFSSSGGSTAANMSSLVSNATEFNKVAVKYKLNDYALWINGVEVATDTSAPTPIGLSELAFDNGASGNDFFGKNKALAVYKEALTDANLRCLTYPNPVATTFDLDFDTIAEQFTFTRGSEATFVNEQGLIESTNTLTSNLVIDEESLPLTGWSRDGDVYTAVNASSNVVLNFTSGFNFSIGDLVEVSYEVFDYVSGQPIVQLSGGGQARYTTPVSSNGIFTETLVLTGNNTAGAIISNNTSPTLKIRNFSIKKVISATNTPRIDYSTGEKAFLLEPQSTNYSMNSEQPSTWHSSGGVIVTPNATTSPEGLQNSSLVVLNASSGNRYARNIFVFSSGSGLHTVTTSYFIKYYNNQWVRLRSIFFNGSPANNVSTYFDVQNGVLGTVGANHTAKIEDYGNGWYRCSITFDIDKSVSTGGYVHIEPMDGDNSGTFAAFGQGFYAYGSQGEELSYPTSYIPTGGAIATRNQELCNNATPVINSEEGTLYAEISALEDDLTFRGLSISDGTTSNACRIYYRNSSNRVQFLFNVGGASQFQQLIDLTNIKDYNKIAFSYKKNNFKVYINGVKVAEDTNGIVPSANTFNKLSFSRADGGESFFGNTKGLKVYPKALADVQLEDLTTI